MRCLNSWLCDFFIWNFSIIRYYWFVFRSLTNIILKFWLGTLISVNGTNYFCCIPVTPLPTLKSSIRLCMANLYNFNAFVLQRLTLSRGQYIFSIRSILIKFLTVKGVFISLLCSWKEQSLPRRFSSLWSSRYRRGHAPLSLAHLLHLS